MCGIFAILNHSKINETIEKSFKSGSGRGPEFSKLVTTQNNVTLGFHRLAINGLNEMSNQPLNVNGITLVCNGEIYNYKQLYRLMNVEPTTQSDCEVIIHCYQKFGIKYTLDVLDGVFAFILIDNQKGELYVARDVYGVRPLFFSFQDSHLSNKDEDYDNRFFFASELKMIHGLTKQKIEQFRPATYSKYVFMDNWVQQEKNVLYYVGYTTQSPSWYYNEVREKLISAVSKRIDSTERPIACLLSGGLDSSLITSIVSSFMDTKGKKLETYSIGLEGSEDLKYARIVADFLKTDHHEIIVSETDFLQAIPEVIKTIESYDTTTVRASVGNYLVAKYIKENSDAKVIFNGDGSDEVTGGYMYFHKAPNSLCFDNECKRLLKDICYFDVLRSDRCISCHGLEARTPFLDKEFVRNYLSLPYKKRYHVDKNQCEKYLLREAFGNYLPVEVLFRTKEAFSDGVSKQTRSWYQIIQEHIESLDLDMTKQFDFNPPQTKEQYYYRSVFEELYPGRSNVIPYFWMPRFVENATDSSARTLDIYKQQMNQEK
jgi:asparagine synthase (glutamine-hydrolysing)